MKNNFDVDHIRRERGVDDGMHLQKPTVKATVSKLTGLHITLDVSQRMAN